MKRLPLFVKCIGGPGDQKHETITATVFRKSLLPRKAEENGDNEVFNLKMQIVNQNVGLRHDIIYEQSETLGRIQRIMEKTWKGIEEIQDRLENYDVIFEYHCLEEELLHGLAYRNENRITDFIMKMIITEFEKEAARVQNIQKDCNVLYLYFMDDPEDCYYSLHAMKRAVDILPQEFITSYHTLKVADYMARKDCKMLIKPIEAGIPEMREFLQKEIKQIVVTSLGPVPQTTEEDDNEEDKPDYEDISDN